MLPEKFKERMKDLLADEYDSFISALEDKNAVRGVRENLKKCNTGTLKELLGDEIIPLDYVENGYVYKSSKPVGSTPMHHSGMIYMQDPGAMATAAALDIKPDWWVLDTCSAPGGKTSQVAERLSDGGFILSNEYVPKRAKIIVGNLERLGIKNAIVTSLDTAELGKMYKGIFDLVIVDAPCSGEGMFRKSEESLTEWSEENVALCAARQKEILDNVACTVKKDGFLLYSTCTYAIEENEMVIDSFIRKHPEYELIRVKEEVERASDSGIRFTGCSTLNIEYTRRFYPHKREGEGQFIALLKRKSTEEKQTILYKDNTKPLSKQEMEAISSFFKSNFKSTPKGRPVKVGENPVLISHGCPVPPRSVFMSGVLLGEIRSGMLHPSHQLFSCYGDEFKLSEELDDGDTRLEAYLRGEEIPSKNTEKGYIAIKYKGATLGGGKLSGGRIKNHYPKGLRNK